MAEEDYMNNQQQMTHDCWLHHDWEGRHKSHFMAYPGLHGRHIEALTNGACKSRIEMLDAIVRSRGPQARVLELGCGKYPLSSQLTAPAEIVLVDLVDFGFEVRPNVKFIQHDLNCDFGSLIMDYTERQRVDLIIICHAAHHIRDQQHFSNHIASILRDDGLLFLEDYIGPRWCKFDRESLAIGTEYLLKLPEAKRLQVDGTVKTAPWRGGI